MWIPPLGLFLRLGESDLDTAILWSQARLNLVQHFNFIFRVMLSLEVINVPSIMQARGLVQL